MDAIKTRQSEMLKMYPVCKKDANGVLMLCPICFDEEHTGDNCNQVTCTE